MILMERDVGLTTLITPISILRLPILMYFHV